MVNKQSLWFLVLFSLVLVLSVYYITMPSELLTTANNNFTEDNKTKTDTIDEEVVIEESDILTALRVSNMEEQEALVKEYNDILVNAEATIDDKNAAYEKLKNLNITKGEAQNLELLIKDEFNLSAFVKIENGSIRVTVSSEKHDSELANNIMNKIQEQYDNKIYISVKFQK